MHSHNVPALRLESFDGEWEMTILGELGSTYGGLTGKKKDDFGHGDAMYITYKDIFSRPLITDTTECDYVEIDTSQNEVRYGDVFFTTSSEVPEEVGLSAVWLVDKPNVYLNSFCFGLRPTGDLDLLFLGYVLRSPAVRSQFRLLAQGISRFNISKTKAANISLSGPPTLEEQQAIGAIFTNLDAAINQHTKKHQALQQAKTALMQRMFPQGDQTVPELRLEGFDGEWAMVRLGSIADMYQPHTISGEELQPSGIPVFGANGFIGFYHSANHQNDQVTISARGEKTGTPSYVPGPSWITGNSMVVNVDYADIDKRFLYADLGAMSLKKFVTGGAQPQLTREVLNEVEAPTPPTLEEQQAIGAVFTRLDTLIATEAQYIESLKQAKAALLQRMFI